MRLTLNGAAVEVDAGARAPLLFLLRERCDARSVRFGCGSGPCGACTVVVDGVAEQSCAVDARLADGKAVLTGEGLRDDAVGAVVLQAFVDTQAAQCGYCITGIVLSLTALLARTPAPDAAALQACLARHLCRCGTHVRILRAARLAVERLAASVGFGGSAAAAPSGGGMRVAVVVPGLSGTPAAVTAGSNAGAAAVPPVGSAGPVTLPPVGSPSPAAVPPVGSPSPAAVPPGVTAHPRLADWVRLRADGRVELRTGKVEIGQGIATALAKIACLELGLVPAQVVLVAGDTARSPDEGYTSGSQSIEFGGAALRHACAALRRVCAGLAAARLAVPASALRVDGGRFVDTASGRGVAYGELRAEVDARADRIDAPPAADAVDAEVAPPPDGAFERRDWVARLTHGGFVHDLVVDAMRHARVLRGAHPAARLQRVDSAALLALPGVTDVVRDGDFLALAGPDEAAIVAAADAARAFVGWALPVLPPCDEVEALLTAMPATTTVAHRAGADPPKAAARRLTRRYSRPYIAHAAIGVSCAVAAPTMSGTAVDGSGGGDASGSNRVGDAGHSGNGGARDANDGDSGSDDAAPTPTLTVWTHSQGVFQLRGEIAHALGLAAAAVRVVHVPGAGCYGHNGADDVAFDAAFLAQRLGRPVRVQWSRQDELTASPVGPASLIELDAGLDGDGRITDWAVDVWSHTHIARPGWGAGGQLLGQRQRQPQHPSAPPTDVPLPNGGGLRNALPGYALPALTVRHHLVADAPLRTSALRSLGAHANVFAIESFVDELAALAGVDALAFRLAHLDDPRARRVVETAARLGGWSARGAGGDGHGLGLAYARYKNRSAYCALSVEVDVDAEVRVRRVWAAVDAGAVVHRDGLLNQIEGGIVQALSWSLREAVRWGPDGVVGRTWEDYPLLAFDAVPEIAVELIEDDPGAPSLGAGELAPGPLAGALGNAVAHALGLRCRHLPLSPQRLLARVHDDDAAAG